MENLTTENILMMLRAMLKIGIELIPVAIGTLLFWYFINKEINRREAAKKKRSV